MVSEQSNPPEEGTVSVADFRRFQASADSRLAQAERQYSEERALNDELAQQVAQFEDRLKQYEARDYANDDPRMQQLHKELTEARAAATQSQRLLKQFTPQLRQALVRAEALALSGGDEAGYKLAVTYLSKAKSPAEITAMAEELRQQVGALGQVPAPRREEIDSGRGSARGGASGAPITQALLEEKRGSDDWLGWYRENKSRINTALAQGGGRLPER